MSAASFSSRLVRSTRRSSAIDRSAASYFVPDELLIEALLAARKRGVRIRILLPGKHIDSVTVKIASKAKDFSGKFPTITVSKNT